MVSRTGLTSAQKPAAVAPAPIVTAPAPPSTPTVASALPAASTTAPVLPATPPTATIPTPTIADTTATAATPIASASPPTEGAAPAPIAAASGPSTADPRIHTFVDGIKVNAIRPATNPADSRVLMNDRPYRVNDIVERTLGLRLTKVEADSLTFTDGNGMVYVKNF